MITFALLAICWPAVCYGERYCPGWWPWCKIVNKPEIAANIETKLDEGNVVVLSHGSIYTPDHPVGSTLFYYDPSTSGFIDTPENRHRCGVENVTEFSNRKLTFEKRELRNVKIQEVFKVVCNPDNKICCRKTRSGQTSCSSLATTSCRPYKSSSYNYTTVYACPVCLKRSSIADNDGKFPFMLTDSTSFSWSLCGLDGVSGIIDCGVVIVEPDADEFKPNEFGELALSYKHHGLINVRFDDRPMIEHEVNYCEKYIGTIHYDPEVHQDPSEASEP